MSDALDSYRSVWRTKGVLRLVYDDFYNRIARICRPGTTIEIGSGIGNLKEKIENVISTDIQFAPWLDCVMDAQSLPFAAESADNIVMVDVLHHVEYVIAFFAEADRVLRPGGRIIMVEPAITWGSTAFYRLLHNEPVVMSADPLVTGAPDPKRDPYAANQAIPTLLATRDRGRFHRQFPSLRIDHIDWFSLLAYPLTGGFKRWSLVSETAAKRLLRIERAIEPLIGRALAFRMMLVIEKNDRCMSDKPRKTD
jgi:SAM-dependent methyltransferase